MSQRLHESATGLVNHLQVDSDGKTDGQQSHFLTM